MRYGLNKQDGIELRKTDVLLFSSFGYRKDTLSNYYTLNLTLTRNSRTAMLINTEKSISKPFAPAYVFIGLGAEYASKRTNIISFSFTSKMTFVLDQRLANQGFCCC
jgi:hypothetical protein